MDAEEVAAGLADRFGLTDDARRAVADALRHASGGSGTTFADGPPPPTLLGPDVDTQDLTAFTGFEVARPVAPGAPERYEDLGLIGLGGMGEVRRVRDRELGRIVAMKLLREELRSNALLAARFREEAQVAAQLQHPALPPVYDVGRLPDGRLWFTMKEVRGRTFREVLREVHAASAGGAWRPGPSGATFARLVDTFATVCEAVGYAHDRGVVHRDLKPANVMIGPYGEVLVLDWGLAKLIGRESPPDDEVTTARSGDDSLRTRMGAVAGTASYMPPEQARGDVSALDARADVYALGSTLYEVLSGRPPYQGPDATLVLAQVLTRPPDPLDEVELPLPDELVALCEAAMSRDAALRPPDANALAREVRAWLEGARKREQALALVEQAGALGPDADRLHERARALRLEAGALLADVPTWAPEARKAPGWARHDEADELDRDARLLSLRAEALLEGALTHAPDLAEAHAALAGVYRDAHAEAERHGDRDRAARAEVRLRTHADALPDAHPERERAAAYLRGDGALTLVTDVPAEVLLHRYELHNRRLVPVFDRSLGRTPLAEVRLGMGRWLCVIRAQGRAEVRYPVQIGRGEHWDGVPPGASGPLPVHVPGDLGPNDVYVPAGWFRAGGDPAATGGLAARRVWCDGFVIRRFPATHAEYLVFLDDLVAQGREDEALRHAPRERGGDDGPGALLYGWAGGRFTLTPAGRAPWAPDAPAVMIDWDAASAYAAWEAARTGRPWRLPCELEWEKAGRGADGRLFPWGDCFDPSWACLWESHEGDPAVAPVDSFPVDESPYGVRGLAGNVRDWCVDLWRPEGPPCPGDRVAAVTDGVYGYRVRRGGSWGDVSGRARLADRDWYVPAIRYDYLGVRLARSCGPSSVAPGAGLS